MTASAPSLAGYTLLGLALIGRTTYRVYDITVGPNAAKAGVVHNFALEGPRGAQYFVTDHGPKYELCSVSMGGARPWMPSPRPLRGLDRKHLAAFGVEVR